LKGSLDQIRGLTAAWNKHYPSMRCADHWRQLVATSGDAIVAYSAVRRSASPSSHAGEIHLVVSAGQRRSSLGSALVAVLLDMRIRDLA
jgi:hypothetical protein